MVHKFFLPFLTFFSHLGLLLFFSSSGVGGCARLRVVTKQTFNVGLSLFQTWSLALSLIRVYVWHERERGGGGRDC